MACYNSTVIAAPAQDVWKTIRDFHDMSWAKGVIESCEPTGGKKGDQIGAKRVLNGAFEETLLGLDDEARTLRYAIDDGPEAVAASNVSGYVGEVRVFPITDGDRAFVEWRSSWADSKGGVKEFCDPIYQALLSALKSHFA